MQVYMVRRMVVAAGALFALGAMGAPLAAAAAEKCPHQMGSQQHLSDAAGAPVADWTLTGLHPSADTAPGYPLAGRLWEATVTVRAVSEAVTPVIPNFSAMGEHHAQYPVLWQLASPSGISAATLPPGQSATGKVYFDVTGADPMMVTYSTGGPKPAMMWCDMAAMAPMMSKPMPMPMDDCPCCDGGCDCCNKPM
ncbi:MAG: MPT63 family protein [Actinobacteria bacterium]|nr:MPT63 family protein [Actinomycetota bacterium]